MTYIIKDNSQKTYSFFDDMESFEKLKDIGMDALIQLEERITEYKEEDLDYINSKKRGGFIYLIYYYTP